MNVELSDGVLVLVLCFMLVYVFILCGNVFVYLFWDGFGELIMIDLIKQDWLIVLCNGCQCFYDFEDGVQIYWWVLSCLMVYLCYMFEDGWMGCLFIEVVVESMGLVLVG